MKFKYSAVIVKDAVWEVVGICDAIDETEARRQLMKNGLTIIDIREATLIDLRIERLRGLQQTMRPKKVMETRRKVNWQLVLIILTIIIPPALVLLFRFLNKKEERKEVENF
jgi:hypothetical protein